VVGWGKVESSKTRQGEAGSGRAWRGKALFQQKGLGMGHYEDRRERDWQAALGRNPETRTLFASLTDAKKVLFSVVWDQAYEAGYQAGESVGRREAREDYKEGR